MADLQAGPVESYGDVAIERWQRQSHYGRGSHRHATCPCIVCADGRALAGTQPFRPSWRALFARWSA